MNRRVVLSLNPDLFAILRNSYVFSMKTAFGRVLIEVARFLIDSRQRSRARHPEKTRPRKSRQGELVRCDLEGMFPKWRSGAKSGQ